MPQAVWQAAEAGHQARVDAWTADHLARRGTGRQHPVEDFLFTYYSHRPAKLRRWHPGPGVVLLGEPARERLGWRHYTEVAVHHPGAGPVTGIGLDVATFLADRSSTVDFVRSLLTATAARPPQLGCFGLHEWAMLYRPDDGSRRHQDWPLRLGQDATDRVVESVPVRCSHFDAFRFFTPAARPLNVLRPDRPDQVAQEQPGCLHATMDLYKWAYKLTPAVPSDLVARCFALAREARLLDMRASPYDLTSIGLSPVRVETVQGRAEYVRQQRSFAESGQVLRAELLDVLALLAAL